MISSANDGSMWPTAKIARAIVGEPPESSSTWKLISAAASKYSHHSAAARIIAAISAPQPPVPASVPVDRGLPGLDDHLAEQDDQEQPEALGEVVGVERLGRVARLQRGPVVVAPRLLRRATSSSSVAPDSIPMAIAQSA